jgi:hypothetical protein
MSVRSAHSVAACLPMSCIGSIARPTTPPKTDVGVSLPKGGCATKRWLFSLDYKHNRLQTAA